MARSLDHLASLARQRDCEPADGGPGMTRTLREDCKRSVNGLIPAKPAWRG